MRVRTAILGGSGYTAVELIKLLLRHPHAEIAAIISGAGHYFNANINFRMDIHCACQHTLTNSTKRRSAIGLLLVQTVIKQIKDAKQ